MKHYSNKAEHVKIAYIGGGSRGWAWGLMSDLATDERLSGSVYLYDIDKQAAYNNEVIGNSILGLDGVKSEWKYKATETIKEALTDADFVIISILPATFDEMHSDVHAPEKYGIYQSVGDTAGPGGLLRALRTIPMITEIAQNIKQYCPNAWVINYTNPMTLSVMALYEAFPQIKAFGCCHEVFGTQNLIADALKEMRGISDVKREEIKVNVLGLNHFTFLNSAYYNGENIMELYSNFVDKYYENGYEGDNKEHWINNTFLSANRVKFDLFKRYGLIAAAGDRHLAEFCPGAWYLKDPETVANWKFGLTTVDWRKDDLQKRLEKSRQLYSGELKFEIKNTGEEGVNQMAALSGLGDFVTNVNMPNIGQMPDILNGFVVETNANFSHNSVKPIIAGSLTPAVQNLTQRHIYNHINTLKATLTKDKDLAFSSFVNDPLMSATLSDARLLFDEMLGNTKAYLSGWNI